MNPIFRSNKQIPPPIFSIVMAVVFICLGSWTITRGWFNTARGVYERIITPSSNPIEFAFWAVTPFLFAIIMVVLAYLGYKRNISDANTMALSSAPEEASSVTQDTATQKVGIEIVMLHAVLGAVIAIPILLGFLYLFPVNEWENPGSIEVTLICAVFVLFSLYQLVSGYMKGDLTLNGQEIKYRDTPKSFIGGMISNWFLIFFIIGLVLAGCLLG